MKHSHCKAELPGFLIDKADSRPRAYSDMTNLSTIEIELCYESDKDSNPRGKATVEVAKYLQDGVAGQCMTLIMSLSQ